MLRFPAAPIHGLQRLHEGHMRAGRAQNFQTYRVITSKAFRRPVKRLFLLHNGLNELTRMGLYYELASHLIAEEPKGTACVVRPFPGHLTRYPYHAFGENPLDSYLWDGSHLFRQFIRHMVETQWLLSACVNRADYRIMSGASLLAPGQTHEDSRLDDTKLAREMKSAWDSLYDSSVPILTTALKTEDKAPGMKGKIAGLAPYRQCVRSLRQYLGLRRYSPLSGDLAPNQPEPQIHVVGYSLGGFAAQSVFMTWPFVVDSCSTLLSGGPLRDLAPTAFADPEEWQTVLHSLRYELDEAMTTGRFDRRPDHIAGIDKELFLSFQRTFYEVFQQEHRGSYQSRLSEFRSRMFFVVGGDDPIVRPQSVLDSGPPGGINLFEVAGLGHFIAQIPATSEEQGQRQFWLPQIGGLITRFATNASALRQKVRSETWLDEKGLLPTLQREGSARPTVSRLTDADRAGVATDGGLPSGVFERHLDDLLARTQEQPNGYLLVLRNEIPTILLDPEAVQRRARSLHHWDERIAAYCRGAHARWEILEAQAARITVVLPWNAERIVGRLDAGHGFPSQSETALGEARTDALVDREWAAGMERCEALAGASDYAVRVFDGRWPLRASDERAAVARLVRTGLKLIDGHRGELPSDASLLVPSLPDCWVWISPKFLGSEKRRSPQEVLHQFSRVADRILNEEDEAGRPKYDELTDLLEQDLLRVVRVSRARYNPRFRGRIVSEVDLVAGTLLQAVLCANAATNFSAYEWDVKEPIRVRISEGARSEVGRVIADRREGQERRKHEVPFAGEDRRVGGDRRLG